MVEQWAGNILQDASYTDKNVVSEEIGTDFSITKFGGKLYWIEISISAYNYIAMMEVSLILNYKGQMALTNAF